MSNLTTTPTRKLLLLELRDLLGPLNDDVAAEWITPWLLQRRDAELLDILYRQRQAQQQQGDAGQDAKRSGASRDLNGGEEHAAAEELPSNGHAAPAENGDGRVPELSRTKPALRRQQAQQQTAQRPQQQKQKQSNGEKEHRADSSSSSAAQEGSRKRRREQDAAAAETAAASPPSHSSSGVSTSAGSAASATPPTPAASQPSVVSVPSFAVLPHGMVEIDIDDVDDSPLPPPRPAAVPSIAASAPPSREQLLAALSFLLPDRDPAFYSSWTPEALVQRVQSAYYEQLYEMSRETLLTPALLFSFAHLLSPALLPSSPPLPAYVDAAISGAVLDICRHIRLAIENDGVGAGGAEGEDEEEEDAVSVRDEARLALSQVLRVSAVIGLSREEADWIRQWIQSVTPVVPVAPAVPAPTIPAVASPVPSGAGDEDDDDDGADAASPAAGSAEKPSIESLTHLSLSAAVAVIKPRFILLDGANIGRWSGSGDPSTEITVSTGSSLPSHLQHLPASTAPLTRSMTRFDSWQVAAAVHAVESSLGTPALICLPEQYVRRPERLGVRDVELLLLLQRQGKLHRLPAGADDDTALIQLAVDSNTWIVTNDNLRDHVYRKTVSRDWVACRLIKFYTLVFPKPLGAGDDDNAAAGGAAAAAARAAGSGLKTMDDALERGSVCLVEPAAMRSRVQQAKDRMEQGRADVAEASEEPPVPDVQLAPPPFPAHPYQYFPPPAMYAPPPGLPFAYPPYYPQYPPAPPPWAAYGSAPPFPSSGYPDLPFIAPSRWFGERAA